MVKIFLQTKLHLVNVKNMIEALHCPVSELQTSVNASGQIITFTLVQLHDYALFPVRRDSIH